VNLITARPAGRANRPRRQRKQKRGRQGGLRAKLRANPHRPSLPSIFLANVRSLTNKIDYLRLRIINHKWIKDCNVMIFTESWLNSGIANSAIELTGLTLHKADSSAEGSGKTRSGGLCIYINKAWCTDIPPLRATALLTWNT